MALIASHAGISVEQIARDSSIWQHFPVGSGSREHPAVTSFVHDVCSRFEVYLTEEEWEDPTPDRLAQYICAKRENASASVADWRHDRREIQRGLRTSVVVLNVLVGTAGLLSASGPWIRRLFVVSGLLLLVDAMFLIVYRAETRKMNASDPGSGYPGRHDRT